MNEIRRYGFIATPRKARTTIVCVNCLGGVCQGEQYYRAVAVGSGLAGIKYPDRVHEKCIDEYLERYKEPWEAREAMYSKIKKEKEEQTDGSTS